MQSAQAKTAQRSINSMLSCMKAANARYDAECASKLSISDLGAAGLLLQPIFELYGSFVHRKLVELDEALVYLRDTALCDLLLSLLRRWPWAEMKQGLLPVTHLVLLPGLLSSLHAFLHIALRVDRSKHAAAYAEMSKRCLCGSSPARTYLSAGKLTHSGACRRARLLCVCVASTNSLYHAGMRAFGCTRL